MPEAIVRRNVFVLTVAQLIARFGTAGATAAGLGPIALFGTAAPSGLDLSQVDISLILLGIGWNFRQGDRHGYRLPWAGRAWPTTRINSSREPSHLGEPPTINCGLSQSHL